MVPARIARLSIVLLLLMCVTRASAHAGADRLCLSQDAHGVLTAPARWDSRDWRNLSIGLIGVGTVGMADHWIREAAYRSRTGATDDVARAVEPFGNYYAFGSLAAFYIAGSAFHNREARTAAIDGVDASILASGLITPVLKLVAGRSRPFESRRADDFHPFSGRTSFPSGHTTESFAVASVVASHYPTPWVQVAAYGIAGLVGYSRVNDNEHYASDVVAGAIIGTVIGRAVVAINGRERSR